MKYVVEKKLEGQQLGSVKIQDAMARIWNISSLDRAQALAVNGASFREMTEEEQAKYVDVSG